MARLRGEQQRRLRAASEEEEDDDDVPIPPLPGLVFAETRTCFDLDVWVQGAMILNNACPTSQGPAVVKASIGGTTLSTKKMGAGSSTPLWNQRLTFGCHTSDEALVFELYTNNDVRKPCSTWTIHDWLAQATLNQGPIGGPEEDVQAQTLMLPRSDGRVNLVVQLASYVHPETKGTKLLDIDSLSSGGAIGAIIGGIILLLIIIFASMWCCCFCCCPRMFQERRRRFWAAYSHRHATATSPTMTRPLSSAPPATVVRPPPPGRTMPTPQPSRPASRPSYAVEPSAPSAYSDHPIAVAMPVAEAINNPYRGGGNVPLAEARVLGGGRAENQPRRGGGAGNGEKEANRKISV